MFLDLKTYQKKKHLVLSGSSLSSEISYFTDERDNNMN